MSDAIEAGLTAIQVGVAISEGRFADALRLTRELADDLVLLVPVDQLKGDLTPTDRVFGDLAADVAEQIKLKSSE